jgi:hypothetical protein
VQKLLYADLGGDTLADSLASAGSDFSFSTLIQGTKLKLGLRLVEEIEGEYVEVDRNVLSIRAKMGELYAQPAAGTWRIWIGDIEVAPVEGVNLTIEIAVGAAASVVQAALNGLSLVGTGGGTLYGTASVTLEDGSYFVTFADETTQTPLRGANLRPDVISFLRVWASVQDGIWTHELRLDKAGLAFADQIIEELPTKPKVSTHRVGVDNGDGTGINARQKIVFNPRFRGIYEVRWSDRISPLLSRDDGPDQFGEALTVLADVDGEFIVTNPSPNVGMVEFAGSMGMQPQDDLEIVVVDNPPADRYVVLDLGEKVCADVLRQMELDDADEVDVPFEIEIRYEDETDEDLVLVWNWQRTVTVRRRLIRDGEATVNDTDYMRPMNSRSYRPFNASQHANGVAFYPFELGDGVNVIHTVDHNLHTLLVDVDLRQNAPGGAWLVEGTDYRVNYDDEGTGEDAIVITLLGDYATTPPEAGDLIGVVVGREVVSEFQEDVTWEIPQTNGLVAELDAIKARLAAIEAGDFGGSAPGPNAVKGTITRPLGRVWIVPRALALPPAPESLVGWNPFDPAAPVRLREQRLLPAVHTETIESLPGFLPVPADSLRGRVWQTATARTDVRGGLQVGDYVACDGREWYRVVQEGDETTYYPADYTVELWRTAINADELALRTTMQLGFGFETALVAPQRQQLARRSAGTWTLVIERGVISRDTAPATTGANLDDYFSAPVTLLSTTIDISEIPSCHRFGLSISRSGAGVITGKATAYFREFALGSPPSSVPFALRARMIRPDFENAIVDARGLPVLRGLDVGTDGKPDPTLGLLTIG